MSLRYANGSFNDDSIGTYDLEMRRESGKGPGNTLDM